MAAGTERLNPRQQPNQSAVEPGAGPAAWHGLDGQAALARLSAAAHGLTAGEVAKRLAQYGPNALRPPKRRGPIARFFDQFRNVLIYVLLVSAAVTALLAHWVDTSVILGVIVVNAIVGFLQEGKAEHAMEAIRGMLSHHATVMRDGRRMSIPAEDLVPGDIVLLESGDRVPADLRLLDTRSLRTQEAALTGESLPVDKDADAVPADAPLGDRHSMAYSGTLVAAGRGTGVVVATGEGTELGCISTMLSEVTTLKTPLLVQMEQFARWLTGGIVVMALLMLAFGVLVRDYGLGEMFLAAVGFMVAAIPEGLPPIMTITLAIGVQRMAQRNAIIRRLPAVETLGSVTVICTDKTGTLTRNEMVVQSVTTRRDFYEVTGTGYAPKGEFLLRGEPVEPETDPLLREMARGALLCSDATLWDVSGNWTVEGDPTEGALVSLAVKAGLDREVEVHTWPRTDVIPFESEHAFMATLHHGADGAGAIYVKGAPEQLLRMCRRQRGGEQDEALDRDYWRRRVAEIAARGQRVLALAAGPAGPHHRSLAFSDLDQGLVFVGLFGLADPPREEAMRAVAQCRQAGIMVKMITGDHAETARAVGRLVGLDGRRTLAGHEVDDIESGDLPDHSVSTDVFARASPAHKLRLVEALQTAGHVVAMTGDGVNDAPALKRADVGVAMGRKGTEVAREAAEMVLADDNFASIAHAVEEGRTVYDNLKKAIIFILPTSGGEALVILAAVAMGGILPITPVQILWINMITAVTLALALGFEPPEPDVMQRPPRRPRAPLLSGYLLWRIAFVSVLLLAGTFGLFLWEHRHGVDVDTARTVAVNTLVMFEAFYLLNCRRLETPAMTSEALRGAGPAALAIALVVVFQLLMTYTRPMQAMFHTRPLDFADWGHILLVSGSVLFVVEAEKWLVRRWLGRRGVPASRDDAINN